MDAWMAAMRRGDFAGAWAISDAVLAARAGTDGDHLPRHLQWAWDGTPVDGRRVLVRCWHGLGDTIMFARFLPALRARAAHVALWAQPELLPLLRWMHGADELLPLDDGPPPSGYDVHVEIMELAHLLRAVPGALGAAVPYLRVPPLVERRDDGTLHAGLAWAAGDWAPERSMRFAQVAPLGAVEGVTWHVLQRGPALAERDPAFGTLARGDVLATARRMRALHLVITVDSMPAHLAGALGVPTWTLLPREADWRWMTGRRTPWYPTMRLVRQRRAGDWDEVVARVARMLARTMRTLARERRVAARAGD